MPKPIALQLYSVRDALGRDFTKVIERIAGMGYLGIEMWNAPGVTPAQAAQLLKSLDLQVPSAHSPAPLGDKKNQVLDMLAAFGCKRLVVPYYPPERFQTVESIQRVCEELNEGNAASRANGLTMAYHNHWWEFETVGGLLPYKVMLEQLDPTIDFEIDTYWAKTGGSDPVAVIKELGPRVPLLHIKDGPTVKGQPMVAVGDGVMNVPAIIEAGTAAEWLIVELDSCATDMLEAVGKSYQYLTGKGLARGRDNQ